MKVWSIGVMIYGQNGLKLTDWRPKFEGETVSEAEEKAIADAKEHFPPELCLEPDEPMRLEESVETIPVPCLVIGK